jgi:hypothetical protein
VGENKTSVAPDKDKATAVSRSTGLVDENQTSVALEKDRAMAAPYATDYRFGGGVRLFSWLIVTLDDRYDAYLHACGSINKDDSIQNVPL